MAIPSKYADRSLYHFTHYENLRSILKHGILSKNEVYRIGFTNRDIAYENIQDRRSVMPLPCGCGGVIHDYVPLYFCKRSPMLFGVVNNKIADEQLIVYLEFPITILDQYPSVFTDASANTSHSPNFFDDTSELVNLDWDAIDTWKWGSKHNTEPTPIRQKKQAEALIYKKLPLDSLKQVVVYNQTAKKYVEKDFKNFKFQIPQILVKKKDYYFLSGKDVIVIGPRLMYKKCMRTIENIAKNLNNSQFPKFDDLLSLRNSLCEGLDCLPETLKLVGLKTENPMHSDDVGTHTCKVVSEIIKTSEYEIMDATDQLLIEIAAYLHDIGKESKTRLGFNGVVQKVDNNHPINALSMVQRILTEDVGYVTARDAKIICKLVCYHDLIGDIVGKGRKIEELERIVNDEIELNMLIAIAKADMESIASSWVTKNESKIEDVRERIMAKLS